MSELNGCGLYATGAIAVFLILGGLSSCETVDAGEVGLVNRYGNIDNQTLSPGLHFVNPITTNIEKMDVKAIRWNGETAAYTSDLQSASVKFAVTYSLTPSKAVQMRRTVGVEWADRLLPPKVESGIKQVFGRTSAMQAIANRQVMQDAIQASLRRSLAPRGITIESFELTNIGYSDAFEKAVEQAQVATQQAVAARNATVTIEEQAKQKVITAEADAKAMRIKSEALANNPGLTAYEAVKKWNGKLPEQMYGSAPLPFVGVGK
jgi:regulator of protease activity HflC (stomatin/prohibitin superfamily)